MGSRGMSPPGPWSLSVKKGMVVIMVFETLVRLLGEQYACDPDEVEMVTTLDDLNLTAMERSDIAVTLEELYGVPIPTEALDGFETVEDVVGYIEDRL